MGFAQLAWKKINLFRAGYVHSQKQYFPCSESGDDPIFGTNHKTFATLSFI